MLATYPQGQQRQSQGRAKIVSIPAPTGGWNTRDSLDEMDPRDAVVMDNLFPQIGKVSLRKGYEDFITGIAADIGGSWAADNIETLFNLVVGGTEQFLCAMDGGIARIDTGTAAQVKVRGSYSSDRWQYTTFAESTTGGNPQIYAVNGTDQPWKYDGTTHADWTPTMSGGTDNDLVWVFSFKNRIYAGEAGSRNFWYSGLGDDTALTEFPLEGIRGAQGNILFMGALTRDTGSGPDDFAVFVTDQGQAIVYQGNNPGDASAWSIVGVYKIPKPINSRRAHSQLFGDIAIATELDYIFLNAALQQSGAVILTPSKLTGAMQEAADVYKENYGWEMVIAEQQNMLLTNIPRTTNSSYHQHIFNLQTRAGARFTGWNFNTFAVHNGNLYAAGNDAVYRVMSQQSDDSSDAENSIEFKVQTAWTDLESPSIKHVKAARPLLRTQGMLKLGAAIGVDFKDPAVVSKASEGPSSNTDTQWGDTSGVNTQWGDAAGAATFWAGTATASSSNAREWRLIGGRGSDFCLSLAAAVKNQAMDWLSTDYKVFLTGKF